MSFPDQVHYSNYASLA